MGRKKINKYNIMCRNHFIQMHDAWRKYKISRQFDNLMQFVFRKIE